MSPPSPSLITPRRAQASTTTAVEGTGPKEMEPEKEMEERVHTPLTLGPGAKSKLRAGAVTRPLGKEE